MMIHELARAIAIFGTLSLFQLIVSRNHRHPLLVLSFTVFILMSGPLLNTQQNSILIILLSLISILFIYMIKRIRKQTTVELKETVTPEPMPLPVIMDGEIQYSQLEQLKQNEFWLRRQIKDLGYRDIKRISYCSVRGDQLYYIDEMDKK